MSMGVCCVSSQGFFLEKLLRGGEIEIAVCEGGIFDPSKLPQNDSPDLSSYGEEFRGVLEDHYGKELAAESIEGEEFIVPTLVSPDIRT